MIALGNKIPKSISVKFFAKVYIIEIKTRNGQKNYA